MNEIYEISHNELFKRYLTAARFIKQGELILKETPLLIDSHRGDNLFCLKCCTYIRSNYFQICKQCKIAIVCRLDCDGKFHCNEECEQLKSLNLTQTFLIKNPQVVAILRLILKKKYCIREWEEINKLEAHLEERRDTEIWRSCEILVGNVLEKAGVLTENDVKNEIIQKMCGILDVNTFEVRPPRDESQIVVQPLQIEALRGLYPKAALMAHDCKSNTYLAVDNDFVLYIHASVDIQKGSPIYFNYANVLYGNIERNKCLKRGKYFECNCKRCSDPSEFKTNISSLKCTSCKKGYIQPQKNENGTIKWTCFLCKKSFNNNLMQTTIKIAKDLINTSGSKSHLENLNKKLQRTLHFQHYLLLELQQTLMGLYTQDVPSTTNLKRKIECCENVIRVTQILEPGISRILGITFYELHAAKANLAYKEYSEKKITSDVLLKRLLSAEETLKLALKHLLYEPKNSPEGVLTQNALGYLKKLRESINDVEKRKRK